MGIDTMKLKWGEGSIELTRYGHEWAAGFGVRRIFMYDPLTHGRWAACYHQLAVHGDTAQDAATGLYIKMKEDVEQLQAAMSAGRTLKWNGNVSVFIPVKGGGWVLSDSASTVKLTRVERARWLAEYDDNYDFAGGMGASTHECVSAQEALDALRLLVIG